VRSALAALIVAGCAMPQYASRPVALTAAPATPFEQARAICSPRAQLAATQARSTTAPTPTSFSCTSTPAGAQVRTECTPRTTTGGYTAAVNAQNAYAETGNAVFASCLAEHGWRLERSCIQNCR
jgi:hypothetical protein